MLAIGVTRFDVSAGSAEFAPSTVSSHQAHGQQMKREEADRRALAEAGDAADQKRLQDELADRRKMRDHFGSA